MNKAELVEKLTMLYEQGKNDHNVEMYEGVELNQHALINEMAENILKSINNGL